MSRHSTHSSSSTNSVQENHYKLRIELFQFERTTMEAHMQNCIEKIQRIHTSYMPGEYKVLPSHDILEFMLMGEVSEAPAFDYFVIQVNLIQQVVPARLFFTASLLETSNYFPGSSYVDSLYQPQGIRSTIFKLDTGDGFLATPPVKGLTVENETLISTFQLSVLLENLSFSRAPFTTYSPVDIKKGKLFFPIRPSHQGQFPQTQTQFYHHITPMYNIPPPPLEPPRILRRNQQNLDESVPWNSNQQTYMTENQDHASRTQDRAEHLKEVRDRMNSSGRQASNKNSAAQQQRVDRPGPSRSQPLPPASAASAAVTNVVTDGARALPAAVASADIHTPQGDNLPVMVPPQGVDGGSQLVPVPAPDLHALFTDGKMPNFSVNLPHLTQSVGSRMEWMHGSTDPRRLFMHDANHDFDWDHYQFEVNCQLPDPPLARSAPKYPNLPMSSNSPYGPGPTTETNPFVALAPTSQSPPITTSPRMTDADISATTVVVPNIVAPAPAQGGARPKPPTPSPPAAKEISNSATTRSSTGNSKPKSLPKDFVDTLGKNFASMKNSGNKKDKKNRSTSEDSKL